MHDVERQVAFAILVHHFFNHRVGIITPATLLIAERPERRQRHVAREIGVTPENLLDRWTMEEVVVHLAAFSAKPRALLRRLPEIKIAAITVVEKDAVSDAALEADVKRNGLIDRISAF